MPFAQLSFHPLDPRNPRALCGRVSDSSYMAIPIASTDFYTALEAEFAVNLLGLIYQSDFNELCKEGEPEEIKAAFIAWISKGISTPDDYLSSCIPQRTKQPPEEADTFYQLSVRAAKDYSSVDILTTVIDKQNRIVQDSVCKAGFCSYVKWQFNQRAIFGESGLALFNERLNAYGIISTKPLSCIQ